MANFKGYVIKKSEDFVTLKYTQDLLKENNKIYIIYITENDRMKLEKYWKSIKYKIFSYIDRKTNEKYGLCIESTLRKMNLMKSPALYIHDNNKMTYDEFCEFFNKNLYLRNMLSNKNYEWIKR